MDLHDRVIFFDLLDRNDFLFAQEKIVEIVEMFASSRLYYFCSTPGMIASFYRRVVLEFTVAFWNRQPKDLLNELLPIEFHAYLATFLRLMNETHFNSFLSAS